MSDKLKKLKKIILAFKVFAPILIKGLTDLWNEIVDAYEENNQLQLSFEHAELEKGVSKDV